MSRRLWIPPDVSDAKAWTPAMRDQWAECGRELVALGIERRLAARIGLAIVAGTYGLACWSEKPAWRSSVGLWDEHRRGQWARLSLKYEDEGVPREEAEERAYLRVKALIDGDLYEASSLGLAEELCLVEPGPAGGAVAPAPTTSATQLTFA